MSKKVSVTNSAAKIAYMQAVYAHSPPWESIVGERISKIFTWSAASLETSLTSVLANILAGISAIVGPRTEVLVTDNQTIKPNVYLLLVGLSGSGKSQAFDYFFSKPLRALEEQKQLNLIVEEFTPAGFLKFLAGSSGHAVFASDEFCQHVKAKVSARNDESLAFRSQLNKFYNGKGVSKAFSSKGILKTDEVYLSILGISQPQPYAAFHGEMVSTMDGLLSRFMVLCAPPVPVEKTPDGEERANPEVRSYKTSSDWVVGYYARLYDLHHGADQILYRFSVEAKEMLESIRETNLQEKRVKYSEAAEKIRQQEFNSCDVPADDTDAKDFEYIVKFAALMHIMTYSVVRGAYFKANFIIPPEIQVSSVERAKTLVVAMRQQQTEFTKIFTEVLTPLDEAAQLTNVLVKEPGTLTRTILTFPGKAVSVNMITRKRKNSRALDVTETMKKLSGAPDGKDYVGQFKSIGRKTHVFYKAAFEKCDKEFLQLHRITEQEYVDNYKADVTTPPVCGIPNWAELYESILAAMPENM